MRLVSIVCSVTIDSTAAMQRNKMKKCFTCIIDSRPFSAGCETNLSCKAGLLTYSGYDAFPVFTSGLKIVVISCVRCRTGTYSSGNCCRLSRHSLLIDRRPYGLLSEPLRGKDTKFTSNKKCFYFLLVCVVLYWSFCLYQYVASPRHSFRSLYKYPVANIVRIDNTVRNTIVLRTIGGCLR